MIEKEPLPETGLQAFNPANFEHAQRVAKMLSSSTLIPKEYQGNIQNTMIALEMANRCGASPLMVMQHLNIIQGKPSWSSTFIISSINTCGRFSPLRFDVTGEGDTLSCVAWANDLSTNDKIYSPKVTMKMAIAEGWVNKQGSKWKTIPELMIMYRCAAFFGRLYCPEILMGMQTTEEIIDVEATVIKPDKEEERIKLLLNDCKTIKEVESLQEQVPHNQIELFETRKEQLKNG